MIGPRQVIAAAGDSFTALPQLPALVQRITQLLGTVEALVVRAAALIDNIGETEVLARSVAERAMTTEAAVADVADQTATSSARIAELLDRFEPALVELHPIVDKTAHQLADTDAEEFAFLIQQVPTLVRTAEDELIPTLQTLRSVAPDLAELLEVSRTLNEMLGAVPGLGRVKKRIDDDDA